MTTYEQPSNGAASQEDTNEVLWDALTTLFRWRYFIGGVTAVVAIAAVIISLLLPNWYRAETRLLLPTDSGLGLFSGAGDSPLAAAASLFGGPSGDYLRYLAILTSRSVQLRVVEAFDLEEVYEVQDAEHPTHAAITQLQDNTEFAVDDAYNFLSVRVLDQDPERAAAMANYFVEVLNETNLRLRTQDASRYRSFLAERYREAEASLDSVMNATRAFQEQHGIMDLEAQAPLFYENLAQLRFNVLQAEIQLEQMRAQYGPDNATVRAAAEAARAADQKYHNALAGSEAVFPVAQAELPQLAREYFELEKEQRIRAQIIEFLRPVYEQARMNEQREVQAVQVLDTAVPPAAKAAPRRSVICILATLSAFALAVMFALAFTWWDRISPSVARRLQYAGSTQSPHRASTPHAG